MGGEGSKEEKRMGTEKKRESEAGIGEREGSDVVWGH